MAEANESPVKQEEFLTLLKGYAPTHKLARERDMLSGRYRIVPGQPLADLNSPFAKAYGVREGDGAESSLYALVFDNNAPLRQKHLAALKKFRHPALVSLVDHGMVDITTLNEARYVCILERPQGQPLSQVLAQGRSAVSETTLISTLLRPLSEVVSAFADMGISHNRINLRNVYLAGDKVMLGECLSDPAGVSQDYLFDPIDRLLASPSGKPDFSPSDDCYALCVLAVHFALGNQPFAQMGKATLIDEILSKGSYHVFAMPWDFPTGLHDFFRGLLAENSRERWDAKTIASWVAGKRFSLIVPSSPRETSRGFEFAGDILYSRKAIAHSMFMRWPEALALLNDNKLSRWLDSNVHKPDVADAIARLSTGLSSDAKRGERHNNELLARVIMMLDPMGPVRMKGISTSVEGVGLLLWQAILGGRQDEARHIAQMIESDLFGFWLEQQKSSGEYGALTSRMQKIRTHLRMSGFGFGVERALYDLVPGLPCQSPMFKRHRVSTLSDLLLVLDILAPQRAGQDNYADRHVAAFITSKLDIQKAVQVNELESVGHMVSDSDLVALKLFMRAQQSAGDVTLKGLSYWMGYRLFPVLDNIHKRERRRKLQGDLRDASGAGSPVIIAKLMFNSSLFSSDTRDFQKTAAAYAARNQQITTLKNHTYIARHARMAGRGAAQTIAFSICFATVYFTLKSYFHF